MTRCRTGGAWLLTGLAAAAGAQPPAGTAVSPLLGQALGQVHDATFEDGEALDSGLFRRLQRRIDDAQAAPKAGAQPISKAPARSPGTSTGQGATGGDLVPSLAYAMEQLDPAGRVADLGTYTLFVDQLNRLPRVAAGKPWAASFQSRLPATSNPGT